MCDLHVYGQVIACCLITSDMVINNLELPIISFCRFGGQISTTLIDIWCCVLGFPGLTKLDLKKHLPPSSARKRSRLKSHPVFSSEMLSSLELYKAESHLRFPPAGSLQTRLFLQKRKISRGICHGLSPTLAYRCTSTETIEYVMTHRCTMMKYLT